MTQTKNLYQRIIGIMADLDYIQKGEKKVNNQYTFVSHDQVTAKIHPLLVKHGVVCIPCVEEITQDGNRTAVKLKVRFFNADNPLEVIATFSCGYGIDQGDKGPGKAISYAFKYAILKTFCLETGDDPDNDQNAKFEASKQVSEGSMSIDEFIKELVRVTDYQHNTEDFKEVSQYLEFLEKERKVKKGALMKQALAPELVERFIQSFFKWKD